ncbi:MAG: DUF559 domain-containing protein [Anaerolineae bacterium]|nr:DUF559 domain-containing protein [Anaerolineae bacterium]
MQRVLVAIVNNPSDLALARDSHWYRIPVGSAHRWARGQWPPHWLAFYQTKVFGAEAHSVRWFAQVRAIQRVTRTELFPEEPPNAKSGREYYQLLLDPLQELPAPILSKRWRRIVFIATTWDKFVTAVEINDLYDGSPLEDHLWAALKQLEIPAERQLYVTRATRAYFLDFALFCVQGNLDLETDGDTWHADPARIPLDSQRDNDLQTLGWKVLRFNGQRLLEAMAEYCIPTIVENINRLGGIAQSDSPRRITLIDQRAFLQYGLFDAPPDSSDGSSGDLP